MVNYNHQPLRDPMNFPPAAPRSFSKTLMASPLALSQDAVRERTMFELEPRPAPLLLTCGIPKSWGILQIPKMMG